MSFDDNTEEAYQCRRMYDFCREALLRQCPWAFARRIAPLALTNHTSPLWGFLYAYPADCVFVRRVFGGKGPAAVFESRQEGSMGRGWDVFSVSEAEKVIAANIPAAHLDYTHDVKDAGLFPPDFVAALYYYLAAELSMSLAADANLKQLNFQLMQSALREGMKQNGNESKGWLERRSAVLEARL
ncbi:MAG: hypothetical protein LBO03_09250 [Acidaminococcales bacterium]|nr:hypothetical protein [Acidaminococcales bacterium]